MAPLAELPALPLHEAGKYVAAAYIVLFAMVLVYMAIMAVRTTRIERELAELLELTEREGGGAAESGTHVTTTVERSAPDGDREASQP
jgi:hypothetical protein